LGLTPDDFFDDDPHVSSITAQSCEINDRQAIYGHRNVYLHGFASSPQSSKAQFFRKRFEEQGLTLEIPSLDGGDFTHLTITGQLQILDDAVDGRPSILIGSSLGGYLAALYAARHANIEKLVLMAPALQFPSRWRERYSPEELARWQREGAVPVFHYGYKREVPLGYQFLEDSRNYEDEPEFTQPALVLHGSRDPVVPASISIGYAARHPNITLRLFDSGHELTDVLEDLWEETAAFLSF
jgi:pimeloyl-ACP methyl ester carboxylesterase